MLDWWKSGVIYQIYVRSFADSPLDRWADGGKAYREKYPDATFADSNSDGIGDLRGVIDHLDHLAWLGVDGIWLSAITASPNADWGYDVADYYVVQPEYGTLADVDDLVTEASKRGIRVLLDLVPNHTSDAHPWFVDARSARTARHRDWYVWADPKPDGSAPNNWVSSFGGPAWTFDEVSGQYYLHNFLPSQPDLNWWNEEVREAFDEILRFWFDRGVAGFRIDVCHMIVKDAELRDNPPATAEDHWMSRMFGQRHVYNSCRPEVHDIMRRWRRLASTYDPPRVLLGETNVNEVETMVTFYGRGDDELHLAFNFPFVNAEFEADELREVLEKTESILPGESWPVWTGSNHDVSRLASRWAGGDPRKCRAALMMLLTLRGTPVLYQGDEIGLLDAKLSVEELRDPIGLRYWPHYAGRDPVRTPMPWRDQPGGGFTAPDVTPWLPIRDVGGRNVAAQRDEQGSLLNLTRELTALRRRMPDLQVGDYTRLEAPPGVWAWRRGEATAVLLNLSDDEATFGNVDGRIVLGTDPARTGEAASRSLALGPWEGVVVTSRGFGASTSGYETR